MSLHDPLGPAGQYTIDAIDLSERNLVKASDGRYSSGAFREPGPDPRPLYFKKVGDGWEVRPQLRGSVRFQPGNLTDPLFLERERPYDLIMCRNVFIYFTPDAKQRAMANIERLLAPEGRLCVTPAEADRLPPGRFVSEGPAEFGLYRRAEVRAEARAPAPAAAKPAPVVTPPPAPALGSAMSAARVLADSGKLAEARAACDALIRANPTDPDAFALLGVIHLAAGNEDAAHDAFGKALYLTPDHLEALSHMIGLCERRGNTARAAALRKRLAALDPSEGA
jgi:chemotaxis protein methyltransferase WspC